MENMDVTLSLKKGKRRAVINGKPERKLMKYRGNLAFCWEEDEIEVVLQKENCDDDRSDDGTRTCVSAVESFATEDSYNTAPESITSFPIPPS